ncbi:hypothetical protein TSPI_04476 [Trichinella spiralis]|uniref:Uncharacterized protein n=1 Tax=Trichinella spiralis TaxID=6334 RepID=A0ABR3KHI0_TRISP
MHEIAFLRFSLAKKTTRLQKVVEALLNFEKGYPFDGDQVCVSRTPRRPDLPYINPQIEDTHPFPLILSELASEHQNNRFYDYTCSFWKFLSVKKINPSYAKLNCRASCSGGLGDQALKVRILHISRHQKPVHNETSSTLLSFLQRSLLLRQSETALLPRIFSSFLLQDLLLIPSDPQFSICKELTCLNSLQLLFLLYSHWFTGMPFLHIKAHVLEVMNLMKTLSMDCCARRRYACVRHVMCHEFIGSISACLSFSHIFLCLKKLWWVNDFADSSEHCAFPCVSSLAAP